MIKLAAGAAAAVALPSIAACARGAASMSPPSPAQKPTGKWDMSWVKRVNKPKRMAFDTFEVASGMGPGWVDAYLSGAAEAYGSTDDINTVLVARHAAVPLVLGDDMWDRLSLGEQLKLKDPTTGETTRRNPFIGFKAGDKYSLVGEKAGIDALMRRGTIVLACNSAFSGYVGILAQKEKLSRDEARRQALATLVPGVYLMPTGVFAIAAAQDAGCNCVVVR